MTTQTGPTIESVREFWNRNPLFSGEARHVPGEKVFFEEHRRIALHEHGGYLDPIFTTGITSDAKVLDVGCGIGFWIHEFCLRGARVTACDLSEKSVQLTQARLQLFGLDADVRLGNAEELSYATGSFDHVNCQGVIHHTPNTDACLREFHRVLRHGGTLCFSVYFKVLPLRWQWLYRIVSTLTKGWLGMRGRGREKMMSAPTPEELVRLYDGAENPIGKAYTRNEIRAMLEGRFQILSEKRFGFPRRVLPFEMPDAVYGMISRVFGLMIVFRCRKI